MASIEIKDGLTNWSYDENKDVFVGQQYRLRAGAPMPVMRGGFVIHTFKAELNRIDSILCTDTLPGSEEFRGQNAGASYFSAQFSRLNVKGGNTFQGSITYMPSYIDEDGYGFN